MVASDTRPDESDKAPMGGARPDVKGIQGVAPEPDDCPQHEDEDLALFLRHDSKKN